MLLAAWASYSSHFSGLRGSKGRREGEGEDRKDASYLMKMRGPMDGVSGNQAKGTLALHTKIYGQPCCYTH